MRNIYILFLLLTSTLSVSQNFTVKELQNLNIKPWNASEALLKQKGYNFVEYRGDDVNERIYHYNKNSINNNSLNRVILYKCLANNCSGITRTSSWYTSSKSNLTKVLKELIDDGYSLTEQTNEGNVVTYEYTQGFQDVFVYCDSSINKYVITARYRK